MSAAISDEVRASCAAIAATAGSVSIDLEALASLAPGPPPELDPVRHFVDGTEADVAAYFLTLDTLNFGSGWFPTLRKRTGCSGYFTVAWCLADRFRAHGPWSPAQLRTLRSDEIADVLGQRRDHELMALYAQALRELGRFLGERDALALVRSARRSAQGLAGELARGMTLFADRGFYKRAQIVPADLALAGVTRFKDLDRLTIFADNLVPHVLRCEGVLSYSDDLAAQIDDGRLLPAGRQEREIRACAVRACELIAARHDVTEHELDNWLWSSGQGARYKARPRHRTRTVYY